MVTSLTKLTQADRLLAEAKTLDDIQEIRDIAEAARAYAKAAQLGVEATNKAAEIKIRAERKAGEMLAQLERGSGPGRGKKMSQAETSFSEYAATLDDAAVARSTAHRWQKIAEVPAEVFEQHIEETKAARDELTSAGVLRLAARPHVANNSGQNEWYTPPIYTEAARRAMGGIDLDPASSDIANQTVKAARYYTAEQNGLRHAWRGRVWMNPPYSQPLVSQFCAKVREEYEAGRIDQACVLVNNATETGWFADLFAVATVVCFVRGRIRFIDTDGNASGAPLQGQAVVYIGDNIMNFSDAFAPLGQVLYV